jgi:hypothetical protein
MDETTEETVVEAPAHVVPPTRHDQAKAAHGAKVWTWIARFTGLALLAAVLGFGFYLAAANAGARAERVELIEQLDQERAKVDALYEQIRSLGEDPVVEPGKTPETIEGPQGPTGPQGVPGDDGRTPTAAEVLAAVQSYCASIGGCVGPAGAQGAPGTTGAKGEPGESIVGPQGPAGPAGPQGEQGIPGANGISVTGVSCVLLDDLSTAFRFTFSDQEVVDVRGPCVP